MKPIRLNLGFAFIAIALSLLGVDGVPVSASPEEEPRPVTLDDDEASRRKLALVMIDALRRDGGGPGGGIFASAPASAKLVGVAQDGFLRLYGRGNQKVAFYVAIAGAGFDGADPGFPGAQLGPFAAGAYALAAQELGGQGRWVSLNCRDCTTDSGGADAAAENVFKFAVNMGGLGANRGGPQ